LFFIFYFYIAIFNTWLIIKQNIVENISICRKGVRSLKNKEDNNIEIWEDIVTIKDLVKALVICMITTFSGYFLAPKDSYKPLLFGLVGAIIGFTISSFVIQPKRKFVQEE
jgi:Na+/H+ antiporter NhaD/arsenite permease-like protein